MSDLMRRQCLHLAILLFATASLRVSASPNPAAEPIDSALARSTASTTTETHPFEPSVPSTSTLTVLYSGSRGSKLEPCGCRSLNLGGIDREAAMTQKTRDAGGGGVLID